MLCLVCASHNGVSESEVLDLFPEMELPVLSSLLHRLTRLCVLTLRCGLIRFQHLQVPPCWPLHAIVIIRVNIFAWTYLWFLSRLGRPWGWSSWTEASTLLHIESNSYNTSANNSGGQDWSSFLSTVSRTLFIERVPSVHSQDRVTWRVADELPWLLQQQEDRTKLQLSLLNLFVSQNLYKRCVTHGYYKKEKKLLRSCVIFIWCLPIVGATSLSCSPIGSM